MTLLAHWTLPVALASYVAQWHTLQCAIKIRLLTGGTRRYEQRARNFVTRRVTGLATGHQLKKTNRTSTAVQLYSYDHVALREEALKEAYSTVLSVLFGRLFPCACAVTRARARGVT